MNSTIDKRVLYLSMCCTAIRTLVPFAQNENFSPQLAALTQLLVGLVFIYFIYREYKKNEIFERKFYIMYLMAAAIGLIIVNQLRIFALTHFTEGMSIGSVLGLDSLFKVIWVFVNAYLFQRFKIASYENMGVEEGKIKKKRSKKKTKKFIEK